MTKTPYRHSEETKRKIGSAHKGRFFPEEHRQRLRDAWARRKAAGLPGTKSGGPGPKADVTE